MSLPDRIGEFGDVSERLLLKESLECAPFQHFVKQVAAPTLPR